MKFAAIREGRIADARHAVADCHACQIDTIIEGIIANGGQLTILSKCHALQACTTPKRSLTNTYHIVADCHARKTAAIIEGIIADARHAVGDCHACQTAAIIEGPFSDARHAVAICHARQTDTIHKRIRWNCRNAL